MSKRIVGYFALSLLLLLAIPARSGRALTPPEAFAPGPDVIMGNLPTLFQAGSNGPTQVGLMMGTDICNNGNVPVNWFRLPETDHPVIPQNLYRLSHGPNNDERFEQIGQSWAMHQFFPLQNNACGFGCTSSPDAAHLGVGCSTADSASINASQPQVGSRAWINPFTGIFPSTANTHTGHAHDGSTHRILVETSDLNQATNPGATYYGEAQLVTAHEYAWCQSHPGECNMFNNVSYRQFLVTGTTSFTFSATGSTVRMTPAIFAWPGATIQMIEPEPGVDGRAYIAYKVTSPSAGFWRYDYAIYNQNLDRGIQSFSVPGGCGFGTGTSLDFHAPLNHPGIANDGTVGDAGYSNVPWTQEGSAAGVIWHTETFAQNPNANAVRWGTLYNFRIQQTTPPTMVNATIGFFKTGAPITVPVLGPASECIPTPSPTPTTPPTATPAPSIIVDPGTPTPNPTPTPVCDELLSQNFDSVTAPALPPGWSSAHWVTSTVTPDSPPNCAFVDDPAVVSDKDLNSPLLVINSALAQVTFRNSYNLEASGGEFLDGGVLEISSPNIHAGAFIDVTDPAVGGSFVIGGYSGKISINSGSAIAGRQAWSGNSGGYITTVVNLGPNVNGQTIRLKFRMVTDPTGGGAGWRIDTMSFAGVCTILPPTPTPTGTPAPTPTATATATPDPCNSVVFREHFDGVNPPALPVSWVASFTPGAANCTTGGTCASGANWATSPTNANTFPNSVFHNAPGCVTDSTLDSPSFYDYSRNQFLSFWHQYDLESGFDGAVLEISINGGPFIDFVTAGGEFQNGGYNGTIATGTLSPIAGRPAWTGSSGGYVLTSARMPAPVVGTQSVVLRFRLATDCTGAGTGWRVDTIDSIYFSVSCTSPTPFPSPPGTPTPTPSPTPMPSPPTQAINLSTRMLVGTDDRVGVGGFIITGTLPKHVLLRAIGPSLTQFGLPNALADTVLELHGPSGFATITNDNWRDDPVQQAAILATGIAPTNNLESAIDKILNPGAYTAVVRGKNNATGVALVEVYDLNQGLDYSKLANISTRAFVTTGDNIVIAGFVLGGSQGGIADRIVVRGLGPSISTFGIPTFLADPTLELRDRNGALLIANNDWQDNPAQAAALTAAGLAPFDAREAAIAATLGPGLYTALLAGRNNGTGIGLVEVYDLGIP